MLLEVDRLDAYYRDFRALFEVSMVVAEGSTVATIGANGAGKSTLMKAIAGTVPIGGGDIRFDGRSLRGVTAYERVADGISLVPEGRRIFRSLSVEENLDVGSFRRRPGPWDRSRVYEVFPLLARLARRSAARLSGGEQQMLAIGRALMANPRLLLLDEVSLGLAPVAVADVYRSQQTVIEGGTTVLLVEQELTRALEVARRVLCMLEGRIVLEGLAAQLTREQITDAYFGLRHNGGRGAAPA
jgi:branched-chain amino acid transport system ATP-binding protein